MRNKEFDKMWFEFLNRQGIDRTKITNSNLKELAEMFCFKYGVDFKHFWEDEE